ncbi:MAG: leucine-rich repeat domain-containing protein, partial [Bacteroidaceae bacterium]|nr:leucine-rich repeat domain-containing protein [Bacteroidaceae bacterium]
SVDMPENISTIGEGAFADCVRLKEITLPYSLTEIGDFAFSGCASATTINIQCKGTSIGGHCFDGCFSVTDVYCTTGIIPDADVTAFSNINPDAVLHVPADAIEEYRCTAPWCDFKHIVAIGQEEETDYISSIQYVFYPEDHTATVVNVVVQNTDRIVIPGTVQIEDKAYQVTTIEGYLCYRNQDLKHIEIEEGVIEIQNSVFSECRNLESVVIPNSVEYIGDHAFSYCPYLRSVKIGKGLKKLRNAFTSHSSVFDLWCYAEQVPETDDNNVNFFQFGENEQSTLHVPASALEAYKSTVPWNHFKNIVALTEEETKIQQPLSPLPRGGEIYNLQGQRISVNSVFPAPSVLPKGVYIVDGKKVWVK